MSQETTTTPIRSQPMNYTTYVRGIMDPDEERAGIALVAHDACKQAMVEWARFNRGTLSKYTLYTTGTTGSLLERELELNVIRLLSGPYGGDAQIGALVAERRVRCVIFFWDPLTTQPHDVDVKALLRLTVLHNVPTACNRVTADFIISSPLFEGMHELKINSKPLYDHSEIEDLLAV